jgi:hypothetical protein
MAATDAATSGRRTARHPLVENILTGGAPDAIRLTAARGALPVPPLDLLYLQVCLLKDEHPEVARAAGESLAEMAPEALESSLREPECDPLVLDHFARSGALQGTALQAAISHPEILDGTLEALAAAAPAEALSLIVTNEVRIIRNPRLLNLLRSNPNLSGDNRRRLTELERDFVGKTQAAVRQAPAAEAVPAEAEALPEEAAPGEEEPPPPFMTAEQEREYEEALRKTPTFQKVMQLNVAEKVQLAMKGNAEERAILIRDSAKMVALQVLRSPKLSDNEICSYANLRSVTEDVLRVIASHRDWTKTYAVAHALVRNPKTPAGLSVQYLPRLGTRDLKVVMGDKNVSELVRRHARTLFLARTQPPKKFGKKAG